MKRLECIQLHVRDAITAEETLRLVAVWFMPIALDVVHGIVPARHNCLGSSSEGYQKRKLWEIKTYTSGHMLTSNNGASVRDHAWQADRDRRIPAETFINAGLQK